MPASRAPRPVVLIFSIGISSAPGYDELNARLINKIKQHANVGHATNSLEANGLINGCTSVRAIFVTDPGSIQKGETRLSDKIVQFARRGGRVVLGAMFSSFVAPPALNKYFSTSWNLPWKAGSYHRTTVFLNSEAESQANGALPRSYSQKAVFLKDVDTKAAWYLPTKHSRTESLVFPPTPIRNRAETPVAFCKVADGWLGYVGDVNAEEDTDTVVLKMLGLI